MPETIELRIAFKGAQEEIDKVLALKNRLNMTWNAVVRESIRSMESMEKDIRDAEDIGSCLQVAWHERIKRVQLVMPKRTKRAKPFARKYIYWISEAERNKYNIYYKDNKEEKMKVTTIKRKNITQEVLRKFSLGFEDYLT